MKLAKTYPIRLVCRLLGVPRSSVYYAAAARPDDEAMLKTALLDLAGEWPTYGYRRLTAMMRRLGWQVNANACVAGWTNSASTGAAPTRTTRTTNSNHAFPRYPNLVKHLEITRPDQVWVADITYIRLRTRVRLPGRAHGCLHPHHPRLAPGPQPRSGPHAGRPGTGPGRGHADDPSLRPGRAVRRHRLRRTFAKTQRPTQHGGGRRTARERLRRTPHAHHQRRGGDLSEYHDFADAQRQIAPLPRRCLQRQTHPLVAGLPDAARVRGTMANASGPRATTTST